MTKFFFIGHRIGFFLIIWRCLLTLSFHKIGNKTLMLITIKNILQSYEACQCTSSHHVPVWREAVLKSSGCEGVKPLIGNPATPPVSSWEKMNYPVSSLKKAPTLLLVTLFNRLQWVIRISFLSFNFHVLINGSEVLLLCISFHCLQAN